MAFDVGQKVVYPNHGVCVIEEVSATNFDDSEDNLYHLRVLSNNSKVMVPENNLDLVGLRPLGSKSEIKSLFDILEDGNIDTYKDWKGRYKQNLDKMKTGRLIEVAEVLKNLCLVSQKKSLSFREKKMYEQAKYFIVCEVSHVRGISEPEAEEAVETALKASLEKMKAAKAQEEKGEADAKKNGSKAAAEKSPAADDSADETGEEKPAAVKQASATKTAAKTTTKKTAAKKSAAKKPAAKKATAKKATASKSTAKKSAKAASEKASAEQSAASEPVEALAS
ncbi:MAG: CarD family transcriptional regulator [Acidobacteriota bacterium]